MHLHQKSLMVGRTALISALKGTIMRNELGGAVITGDTGMGKSTLARHLAVHTKSEAVSFLLQATQAMSDIPYGVLTPYLEPALDLGSPLPVMRNLLAYFRREAAGQPILVILDDAHQLDGESTHLLTQLVVAGSINLLAFTRQAAGSVQELHSLADDGLLARFGLEPLSTDEVGEICQHVLGQTTARGACEHLAMQSGGNPLFLRSIIRHAVATRCLVETNGVWILTREYHGIDPSLKDLVASALSQLPKAERETLEAAALGGRVPFTDLARINGEKSVKNLLADGLIEAVPNDLTTAVCNPPLYGRIIPTLVPKSRSIELRRMIVEPKAPMPRIEDGGTRQVHWALDCGDAVNDDVLLMAAHAAVDAQDPHSALRFTAGVAEAANLPRAAIAAARAQFLLGEFATVEASMDALMEPLPSGSVLEDAAVLAFRAELALHGRPHVLHDIVDRWDVLLSSGAGEVDQQGRQVNSGGRRGARDRSVAHVAILRGLAHNLQGRYLETEENLRPLLEAERLDDGLDLLGSSILGEALNGSGRGEEAKRFTSRAVRLMNRSPWVPSEYRNLAFTRHLAVLIETGELAEAETAVREYRRTPLKDHLYFGGTLAVLEAVLEIRKGDVRGGLDLLKPAIEVLRFIDRDAFLPYALGAGSWAAAVVGDAEFAVALATESDRVRHRGAVAYSLLGGAYAGASRYLLDRRKERLVPLHEMAEAARKKSMASCEMAILKLLVLLGDEDEVDRLAELTASLDGAEAEILHQFAAGILAKDSAKLVQSGTQAQNRRMPYIAVDAAARALNIFVAQGNPSAQRGALRVLRQRTDALEHAITPLEAGGNEIRDLTERERKIASLAVQGASNRLIAETLTVSPRTVEGHLYRIYVKLGITKREELAIAFRTGRSSK